MSDNNNTGGNGNTGVFRAWELRSIADVKCFFRDMGVILYRGWMEFTILFGMWVVVLFFRAIYLDRWSLAWWLGIAFAFLNVVALGRIWERYSRALKHERKKQRQEKEKELRRANMTLEEVGKLTESAVLDHMAKQAYNLAAEIRESDDAKRIARAMLDEIRLINRERSHTEETSGAS